MAKRGELSRFIDTYSGDVALEDYQYCVVVQGTTYNTCTLPGAAGAGKILGVIWNKPDEGSGKTISVLREGIAKVILAGTVVPGSELEIANTSGHVRAYTAGSGNGRVGRADEGGASGARITVYINPIDFSQILT